MREQADDAPRANSATTDTTSDTQKAAMPSSTRYGITGMIAPIAKAVKLDPPAASGEPIVSPDSPISSRTKVSTARP